MLSNPMKEDTVKFLRATFPRVFRHLEVIEVDMGWYHIVRDLCELLENEIAREPNEEAFYAKAIKEKFGGLRFYMSNYTPKMKDLIDDANELSFLTCEYCAAPGSPGGRFWIKTVCDDHYREIMKGP